MVQFFGWPYIDYMDDLNESAGPSTPESEVEPSQLRRSSTKRLIGGVAGGVAERFDIDVSIVRVIFVVLACIWGLGLAVYLAMWVIVPRSISSEDEPRTSREDVPVATNRWPYVALAVGVIVVAIIFSTTAGGHPRFGPGLALVWLIFLVSLAVLALRRPSRRWTFRRLVAMAFLVGVSIIILVSGAFLSVVGVIGVPMRGGSGLRFVQPTALASTGHSYVSEFGKSTVDLSSVNFPANGFRVSASVAVGVLDVVVPANAIVDLRTHVGIGTVTFLTSGGDTYSHFAAVPISLVTARQRALAPHLTIDAQVGIGQVVVTRAIR
ncbi:MAG: PspC domain-containing protein [Acidimicrobiaceae bacterium]|nr:PspC domain-containing protein [Acidimicrobiaceae bacterium]